MPKIKIKEVDPLLKVEKRTLITKQEFLYLIKNERHPLHKDVVMESNKKVTIFYIKH